MTTLAFLVLVFVALSAVLSGVETGLYSLEPVRLRVQAAAGDARARALLGIVRAPALTVCTILIGNNVANFLVAALSGALLARFLPSDLDDFERELRNTAYVVPVLFVFGELAPKTLFMRFPGALVPLVLPLFRLVRILFFPIARAMVALMGLLTGRRGEAQEVASVLGRRAVLDLLTAGDEAGRLSEAQRALAIQVLMIRGLEVRHRMVPLARVAWIDAEAGVEAIVDAAVRSGHDRILVRDGATRRFSGYVTSVDAALLRRDRPALGAILKPLADVGARDQLLHALVVLQRTRRPIAIVHDRGLPVGILTTTDLVEVLLHEGTAHLARPWVEGVSGEPGRGSRREGERHKQRPA